MPSVALETFHGASIIILRILDWLPWIIDMLDSLTQPHNSVPYVQIGMKDNNIVIIGNCIWHRF
jgi:hypothetical protein